MIWYILGIGIAIVAIVFLWKNDIPETVIGGIFASIGLLLLGFIAAFILHVISSCVVTAGVEDFKKTESIQEIYSVSDSMGVSGEFFLGSGQVDSDLVYFYAIDSENGIHIEAAPREHSYIKYANENKVITVSYGFKSNALYLFADCTKEKDYIFCVPEGTVSNSFNIDLS